MSGQTSQDGVMASRPIDLLAEAAAASRAEAIRCRTCGYSLVGLPTNVCPECGHHFDPANPFTTTSEIAPDERKRFARSSIAALWTFIAIPLLLVWFIDMLWFDLTIVMALIGANRLLEKRGWWGDALAVLFGVYLLGLTALFVQLNPLDPIAWTVRRNHVPAWAPLIGLVWCGANLWLWYRWYRARTFPA